MRVIFVHFTSLAFTALATHFFFFTNVADISNLTDVLWPSTRQTWHYVNSLLLKHKKKPSNCWGKRAGGPQLILDCKQYWKGHLITSPKKNDFVFKHVRGDGKHFMQELNGVKQLVCAPGEWHLWLFLSMAATFDRKCFFILPFHRCWLWITPACFSHTSSSCAFSNVFVWVSTLPWSGSRVSVQAHRTILRIWAVTNVCFSHI